MQTWNNILQRIQDGNAPPPRRDVRSSEKWRAALTHEVFAITRQGGTEPPFSAASCMLIEPVQYACACCEEILFDAREKFDSGTGWPSFGQSAADNVIAYRSDESHGMSRVEVQCAICDAHLGHVFPDGPPPTYLRYCINGLALKRV